MATQGLGMWCKFDPEAHGTFRNGIVLRQHYEEAHADVFQESRRVNVRCKLCDDVFLEGTADKHFRVKHPDAEMWQGNVSWDNVPEPKPKVPRDTRPRGESSSHPVVQERHAYRNGWSVDDIVLPVVTQLAGGPHGVIRVEALAAVLAWREATEEMIDAVARR